MTPRAATLIGLTAILMWSLLSVLTVATGKIPAFQLAAMTFAIGALVAFASFLFRPAAFGALKQPPIAWASSSTLEARRGAGLEGNGEVGRPYLQRPTSFSLVSSSGESHGVGSA